MNPLVAPHIQYYSVIPTNGVIWEVWHAQNWRHEIDRHLLSPMYDGGQNNHFFIDEPALLSTNKMIVPIRWLQDEKGKVWADAWEVDFDEMTVSLQNFVHHSREDHHEKRLCARAKPGKPKVYQRCQSMPKHCRAS
jgi:hypothetical protein